MSVTIRFFARFRELLGTDIVVDNGDGLILTDLIRYCSIEKQRRL